MSSAPPAVVGEPAPSAPQQRRLHRGWIVSGALAAVLVVGVGVCEWWGWPFLAAPLQRALSSALDRPVMLAQRAPGASAAASSSDDAFTDTRIRFLGGLTLRTRRLEIGAPSWSKATHMLVVDRGTVELRYIDLWRARGGAPLRIKRLQADQLDAVIERLADGRASWQFAPKPADDQHSAGVPAFDRLQVGDARFSYTDQSLKADLSGRFSLREGGSDVTLAGGPPSGLRADAKGTYRGQPVKVELRSSGVLPWIGDEAATVALPLTIDLRAGPAEFRFDGTATDLANFAGLAGKVLVSGPSLAFVGDVLGVTLPTTHPFKAVGAVQKDHSVWNVRLDDATVGASRLRAALRYDGQAQRPLLSGRVGGSKLQLSDLGPVIGKDAQPAETKPTEAKGGRVLPDRQFDLPSLRAMDANVLLDFAELDLGTERAEPLRPLKAHLTLRSGVLEVSDIDARTAQGRLYGKLALDGTGQQALWRTDLGWEGVQLERWLKQERKNGAPPYLTGSLSGIAKLEGRGKSTAEILGDMKGHLRTELSGGTISHLIIEAAGLDIAEGLGLLFRGDDSLKVRCGLADLQAEKGVLRPRAMVVDTVDSITWVEGSVSLADESLALRAVVTPKDFSPFTLRTPLLVRGTLGDPKLSLDVKPLLPRIGASVLLGLINPLAALLPMIDTGGQRDQGEQGCQHLARRASEAAGRLAPGGLSKLFSR